MTPSFPTFFIASEIISPTSASELAEILPTCAIDVSSLQGFEIFCNCSIIAAVALSIPLFRSIGFIPAATDFRPSLRTACASTVAVVVPSPAISDVCDATSLTICAPIFSNLSSSSISFATETPSFVTVGAPKLLSRTTFLPFGPSVTFTALANTFTPVNIFDLASSLNFTSLADI